MRGNEKVIALLNQALKEELTAINQYFVHAEMNENWGYERLSKHAKKLAIDEMKHAEKLIERILFLDGQPVNGSKELLDKLLADEEGHADYLETQLHLIQEVGLDNYLAQQLGE